MEKKKSKFDRKTRFFSYLLQQRYSRLFFILHFKVTWKDSNKAKTNATVLIEVGVKMKSEKSSKYK